MLGPSPWFAAEFNRPGRGRAARGNFLETPKGEPRLLGKTPNENSLSPDWLVTKLKGN